MNESSLSSPDLDLDLEPVLAHVVDLVLAAFAAHDDDDDDDPPGGRPDDVADIVLVDRTHLLVPIFSSARHA